MELEQEQEQEQEQQQQQEEYDARSQLFARSTVLGGEHQRKASAGRCDVVLFA